VDEASKAFAVCVQGGAILAVLGSIPRHVKAMFAGSGRQEPGGIATGDLHRGRVRTDGDGGVLLEKRIEEHCSGCGRSSVPGSSAAC